jgi:hypothetical protein
VVYAVVRALAPQCGHTRGVVRAANVSPDAPLEIWALTKSCGPPADSPSRCQRTLGSRTRSYIRPRTRPAAQASPDSWASVLPLRSAAEQMPQRLVQAGTAKPVICLLQPRRQHPLIGAREFPRTLLAE